METRRLITAILVTMLAVFAFQYGMNWVAKKKGWDTTSRPQQPTTQQVAQSTTAPTTTNPTTQPTGSAASAQPTLSAPAWRIVAPPATRPGAVDSVTIGSEQRNHDLYHMGIELVRQGAAIDQVVLNQFKRTYKGDDPYVFQTPIKGSEATTRAMATLAVIVDGNRVELNDAEWTLESFDTESATFVTTIEQAESGPVLELRKHFRVLPATDPSRGYEAVVTHSIRNLSQQPRNVQLVINGTLAPPREVDRGPDRYMVAGYDANPRPEQVQPTIAHHVIEELDKDSPTIDITQYESYAMTWAGALSVYFNALARPVAPGDGDVVFTPIEKAEAIGFNLDAEAEHREAAVRFQTAAVQLAPGKVAQLPMRVFFGPRQRTLLKEDYFAALGYDQTLVLTGGPCAICTFQWLIDLLVLLLRAFHFIAQDWGLAIIGLVVLVRLLLHPITKKSQISMMRMAKLGPEMERIRKKYGDNKEEMSRAMMEFHKQQGIGPYLGCLPMFLQMPIWIALWSALYSTFELRHAPFLYGFTWIDDLSKPDALVAFPHTIKFFFLHINGINLLPILMGVVFYLQMKLQPKPAAMTKEQEQQQKIMQWMMPLLFPVMLYSGPSGLNLYILTSTLIGIWESKRIRDHIKQQEEREAQQRVIVDAKPTRASKQKKYDPPQDAPKTGVTGWFARVQEWADQQRREQERRGKGKA
jgi:YidC/Oxa1 family membrane protein insertase